ncbi:MAG: hypothetical protein RMJ51_02930 [Candidatus Calescibacterium sp.]|nr:hypothetical protein [Candidatus Calescibacterium sp.]MCX7972220.1 hypothetical protein [bacterium]MDW8195179.1 hypothetical protein [Candidatus Calescibacterium sp.]
MNVFVSVCDYSSEEYAAKLIGYIRNNVQGNIFVIGGRILRGLSDDKLTFLLDSVRYSSIGFFENLSLIPWMYLDYIKLRSFLEKTEIDLAILFDSPAVNLKLIPIFKSKRSKIVYIIPPKTWSMQRTLIHKFIEDNCDLVIVPFKFNLKVYTGPNVYFVGHPIVDTIANQEFEAKKNLDTVGIFPGSRSFEIKFVSKPVFQILDKIRDRFRKVWVSSTPNTQDYIVSKFGNRINKDFFLESDYISMVSSIGLALAVSGTVVLKNSILSIPTISFYKVYKISEFIFRKLKRISVEKISLPNILWEYEFEKGREKIVPELVQEEYNPLQLLRTIDEVLVNYDYYLEKIKEFRRTFWQFYSPGTIRKISELINDYFLQSKKG